MKETFIAKPYTSGHSKVITIPDSLASFHKEVLSRKVRVTIQSTPKEKVEE